MSNINQYENFRSRLHTASTSQMNVCVCVHAYMFIQMLNNLQAFYVIVLITLTNLLWEIMQSRKDNLAICNPSEPSRT
jgi:hypothetical protein